MTERYVEIDATKKHKGDFRYGRDELNLAEFPLASLSDTVPKGQKTLEFSDRIWDHGRREEVIRRVIVTASDKYGLPTPKDDEVLLALVQLSAARKFESPTVSFTRYQILKELGWRDSSSNYKRLELALNRWLGVSLYYDRAWWSKEDQCWVNLKFHILEEVELLDRAVREKRVRESEGDKSRGQSRFTWNERVFRNFQAGNLKQLDMGIIRALKRPTAKRMYRYLSKHFYRRSTIKMRLQHFAYEHIGVPRTYHAGEIKRFLNTSIKELEQVGFVRPLPKEERFIKEDGQWYVIFRCAKSRRLASAPATAGTDSGLVKQLVDHGIGKPQAIQLATDYEPSLIQGQLEYLDYLIKTNDRRVSRNPAGYLYKAITESYAIPKTFETRAARAKRQQNAQRSSLNKQRDAEKKEARAIQQAKKQQQWFEREWAKLEPDERAVIEQDIEKKVKGFLKTTEGPAAEALRESSRRDALRSRKQGTAR